MTTAPLYLGIEIGGTKLQAALGHADGTIIHRQRVHADAQGGGTRICQQMAEISRDCLEFARRNQLNVRSAGIGFGGPVDPSAGIVCTSHQVRGWENFPIVDWFSKTIGLPAALGNDSDLAGLAEAHYGAGKGCMRVVYMNIGSGIGGAIILDGKLYTSQGAGASEIGHLRIAPRGVKEPWFTLEDLASGWNMAKQAQQAAKHKPESALAKHASTISQIDSIALVQAVCEGDPAACEIWHRAIEYLGVAVANVITLLRPEVFILGGGVALAEDTLLDPLREQIDRQAFMPFKSSTRIVTAELGEDVVLHGALKITQDMSLSEE